MAKRATPDAYWECNAGCGYKSWNIQKVKEHEKQAQHYTERAPVVVA